jgi:hypothetical protein
MTTITTKHFDSLNYVKQAKKLGTSEELAELQARQIEQAIDIAVATIKDEIALKDLATKKDLETTKNQIIIWVGGLLFASGLIQHFFK